MGSGPDATLGFIPVDPLCLVKLWELFGFESATEIYKHTAAGHESSH